MLVYDQPIDQARAGRRPARTRRPAGFSVLDLVQPAVAAKDHDRLGRAALRLRSPSLIGKSLTPEIHRHRPALCRPPRIAAGRSRTDAARPGRLRPRDGGRKPGAPDHLEQRAAAGDPATPISTRIPNSAAATPRACCRIAARPVRDRAPRPTAEQQKLIQMAALEALNRHINVKKTDRTFIVDIEVWSYEPAKAAMLANAICQRLSRRIQAVAGRRRAARHQRSVRPAEGIAGAAAQRRERARGLQGAEQFRRHPGHADQRPAALRQQPAARRGARADAGRAGQIRPDRSQPRAADRCRRHSRSAAVADHRQSARAICRSARSARRNCRANWARGIRRCARPRSRSRTCAAPSTRRSIASRSRRRTT